ncbi:TetR/AcrR family transcriptional regulator [Nocardia bhagyanarayanae]|uniref:TetR family transcriptional regulator n=1 Tax=Nocardia bhagyanarayanae TaxID=1215925 RepID=A0A543F9Q6_9NOCA|nr:TetR/AcrR family transcriptional regulator [Nocardia bhagyanarayanae]TQM30553.1 TetR family transcriptional regulator [Nocardia bhagyanarayanae]
MAGNEPLSERLIAVGVELLEQEGPDRLGLRAITRAAGVSHGAPRRHFPTHKALLAAIAARGFADLAARFAAADDASAPARDRLRRMAIDYIDFAATRPQMFTLMFRHDLLEGSGANLRATTLPLFDHFADLVRQASPSADRPLLLWTALHGLATLRANESLTLIAPTAADPTLVDQILQLHLP